MLTGKGGGLIQLVLSALGVVIYITLFATILDGIVTMVGSGATVANYTILNTVIKLSPVVLMVAIPSFLGFNAYKGYGKIASNDPGGFMRIILGVLWIVLFVSMFATILTGFEGVRGHANITYFTALSTVTVVMPTIIFLAGIFAGGLMAVGGGRARWGKKKAALA